MPVITQGPYNGSNPYPFADNTGEVYNRFWEKYQSMSKKRFWGNRYMYDEGCYWDEIRPEDLWEVWNFVTPDDRPIDIKYHDTWQEKADLERIEEIPEDWETSDEVYTTQQAQELPGLYDDENSEPILVEEPDSDEEDEIIELQVIHHPDPQKERRQMQYHFWKDLWRNIPSDTTYQAWQEEDSLPIPHDEPETTFSQRPDRKEIEEERRIIRIRHEFRVHQEADRREQEWTPPPERRGYTEAIMKELRPTEVHVLQVNEEQHDRVRIKKLQNDAIIPRRTTPGAAGYDLHAAHDAVIQGKGGSLIGTGIAIAIPLGQHGQIRSRSRLFKNTGLTAFPGTIDSDYRGELMIIMINSHLGIFDIYKGDRIAQMVILRNEISEWEEVDDLDATERGSGGFGSTGVNVIIERLDEEMKPDKHIYHVNPDLLPHQIQQIKDLMKEFEDIIAISFADIPKKAHFTHHIDTGDAKPIKKTPYRIPPAYHDFVRHHIKELLDNGIIVPSKSPWASPISIVPKKDGRRVVIDYRALNTVTKKDSFPIPNSEDLQNMLEGAQYYTTLDLWAGYNQIGMTPEAQERSAFVTAFGHYEFTRMSFGLCNAPASFQKAMNEIFFDMIGHGVIVYIDNINVYAETFEKHMRLLREVLTRLRKYTLRIKPR